MDIDEIEDAEVAGESKADRFRRVAGPRIKAAVKRLRMIRQMVDGANANNYEFTDAQRNAVVSGLKSEVEEIDRLMKRRLNDFEDEVPSFI
jgi:hypothetical protein